MAVVPVRIPVGGGVCDATASRKRGLVFSQVSVGECPACFVQHGIGQPKHVADWAAKDRLRPKTWRRYPLHPTCSVYHLAPHDFHWMHTSDDGGHRIMRCLLCFQSPHRTIFVLYHADIGPSEPHWNWNCVHYFGLKGQKKGSNDFSNHLCVHRQHM